MLCREKDGLWAVLAWLSILAHANKGDEGGFLQTQYQKFVTAAPGVRVWKSVM